MIMLNILHFTMKYFAKFINNCIQGMQSQTHIQIISKLVEVILQGRMNVKKKLFSHFQTYLDSYKDNQASLWKVMVAEFLSLLLPKEQYGVKQKIQLKHQGQKQAHLIAMQIRFNLTERVHGNKLQVQNWSILLEKKKEINKQSINLLFCCFKEVIHLISKLPLFSIYQKDKQLKSKYIVNYKIQFDHSKKCTLVDYRAKDCLIRQNQQIKIHLEVDYYPSFNLLTEKRTEVQDSKRKPSATISQQGDGKISVYAFYDPDLDFTFLSSDDEDFNKQGNPPSEQISMNIQNESQEFELLISNDEEQFLNNNQYLFGSMKKYQKEYL